MSGRKTVTIDSYEYDNLVRSSRDLTNVKRAYSALQQLADANNESYRQLRSQNESLTKRIQDLNSSVQSGRKETSELRNQLAAQARMQQEQLRSQAVEFERRTNDLRSGLEAQIHQLDNDVNDRIEANNRIIDETIRRNTNQLRSEMAEYSNRLNSRINTLNSQVEQIDHSVKAMMNSDEQLFSMARDYYNAATAVIEDTKEFYTFLEAERWNQALSNIEAANLDIQLTEKNPRNAGAARLSARLAYRNALEVQHRIISQQIVWQNMLERAMDTIGVVEAEIKANQELTVTENFDEPYKLSVDYWSNGALSVISSRLSVIKAQLERAREDELSVEDICSLQEQATDCIQETQNVSAFALSAFNSSVERFDIADVVSRDPHFTHLTQRQSAYEGGDQRARYRATLRNAVNGDEIVLTITPEIGEEGMVANNIQIDLLNNRQHNSAVISESQDQYMRDILSVLRSTAKKVPDRVSSDVSAMPGYDDRLSDMKSPDMNQWENEPEPEVVTYQQGTVPTKVSQGARRRQAAGRKIPR